MGGEKITFQCQERTGSVAGAENLERAAKSQWKGKPVRKQLIGNVPEDKKSRIHRGTRDLVSRLSKVVLDVTVYLCFPSHHTSKGACFMQGRAEPTRSTLAYLT